jgi:hypothetical protein
VYCLHALPGHQPSAAAQAALVSAALEVGQQQKQEKQYKPPGGQLLTGYTAAELSCLLYCLASWGAVVPHELLEALQQQLAAGLTAGGTGATGDVSSSSSGVAGTSSSAAAHWDAGAVCSSCWALVTLGATLPQQTLQAAEQRLLRLVPDPGTQSSTEVAAVAAVSGGSEAPTAADLAMFGLACRQSGYQPLELLTRFRNWLLLQLARRGPTGLLKLVRRSSSAPTAAATARGGGGGRVRELPVSSSDAKAPASSIGSP